MGSPEGSADLLVIAGGRSVLDLGLLECCEPVRGGWTLFNGSSAPVTVTSVRQSCSCTSKLLEERVIAPGSSTSIELILDPQGMDGPFSVHAVVEASGENRLQSLTLRMKGVVVPAVACRLEPSAVSGSGWLPLELVLTGLGTRQINIAPDRDASAWVPAGPPSPAPGGGWIIPILVDVQPTPCHARVQRITGRLNGGEFACALRVEAGFGEGCGRDLFVGRVPRGGCVRASVPGWRATGPVSCSVPWIAVETVERGGAEGLVVLVRHPGSSGAGPFLERIVWAESEGPRTIRVAGVLE